MVVKLVAQPGGVLMRGTETVNQTQCQSGMLSGGHVAQPQQSAEAGMLKGWPKQRAVAGVRSGPSDKFTCAVRQE